MKAIKYAFYTVSILFWAWLILSWFEIGFSLEPYPVYSPYNFFTVMF